MHPMHSTSQLPLWHSMPSKQPAPSAPLAVKAAEQAASMLAETPA